MSRGPAAGCRITVVQDQVLFAESVAIALKMEGHDVRRVPLDGTLRDVSSLLAMIRRTLPRLVLLDLDLGEHGSGMRLVEPLVVNGIMVIVITGREEPALWGEAIALGARRVISKAAPLNDVLDTIGRVNDGLPVVTSAERRDMIRAWHREAHEVREARAGLQRLTRGESEVLAHLIAGREVRQIARHRVVSEATVRTQIKAVLGKLGVSSQVAAVGLARRAGWDSVNRTAQPRLVSASRQRPW